MYPLTNNILLGFTRVHIQPDIQDIIQCFGRYHGTHPQGRPVYSFKYTRIRSSTFAVTISRRGNGTGLGFWAVGVTSGSTCVVNGFNLEINRFNTRLNRNSSDLITGRRKVICDFDCRYILQPITRVAFVYCRIENELDRRSNRHAIVLRYKPVRTKPRRVFRLQASDFRLPTFDSRLLIPTCNFVAMKGGGRPTRLLPYAKMLLAPITFFPFCWVDYALEGSG